MPLLFLWLSPEFMGLLCSLEPLFLQLVLARSSRGCPPDYSFHISPRMDVSSIPVVPPGLLAASTPSPGCPLPWLWEKSGSPHLTHPHSPQSGLQLPILGLSFHPLTHACCPLSAKPPGVAWELNIQYYNILRLWTQTLQQNTSKLNPATY